MGGQKSLAVLMSFMGGLDYENEATLELPIMSSLRAGNDDKYCMVRKSSLNI